MDLAERHFAAANQAREDADALGEAAWSGAGEHAEIAVWLRKASDAHHTAATLLIKATGSKDETPV